MTAAIDGLYALVSLDGSPLAPGELATLGLAGPAVAGAAAGAVDRGVGIDAGQAGPAGTAAFLGHLDDPAAIAAALGLPSATPAVDLVAATVARHGDAAAALLPGEWSYLGWDPRTATLTLLAASTLRDALMFATDGRRAAVAPHPRALRRLPWVGARPGPGMLVMMGRGPLRGTIGDRTMLPGVRRVEAGSRVTVTRAGVRAGAPAPLSDPVDWQGSFAEAMAACDAAMRRILDAQLARHPVSAVMLSGGLDSSLVAVYAANAARAVRGRAIAVTSAAPPGSGLADEVEFAAAVAAQAGIAMRPVCPGPEGDPYQPSPDTLRWLEHPLCSPRHYVYDALYRVAAEAGADAILDGVDGEMTLTGWPDRPGWRGRARAAVGRLVRPRPAPVAEGAFHVRLSRDALAMAAAELPDAGAVSPPPDPPRRRGDDRWGYSPDIDKKRRETTASPLPGLRRLSPFRDRALLGLAAGLPYRFMTHGGMTRAPARTLLAGRVPDAVRLRAVGRPFAPDFDARLQRYAAAARARLPDQARAGASAWLDLAWLDATLAAIDAGAAVAPAIVLEAQMTACAAAFLADWETPR